MKTRIVTFLLLAIATVLLAACGAPANEPPATSITSATSTTTASSATIPALTVTATATATATNITPGQTVEPSPSATPPAEPGETRVPDATATAPGPEAGVGTDVIGSNVFKFILGAVDAPEGVSVRACDWDAPVLCVLSNEEVVGQVELYMSHLETLTDFQQTLESEELTPGSIDYRNAEQAPRIIAALRTFVEDYHKTFEEDRRLTYGEGKATYTRPETQDLRLGDIPGLRYGFVVSDNAGNLLERWISFGSFDGDVLYILSLHYDPRSHMSFRSDEELQEFEPYMREIAAGLKLPLPVLETNVKRIVTLASVPLFRFYGNGSNPVAEVPAGQTLNVTGRTPDERAWRVECPNNLSGPCWVSAHTKLTQPDMP